MPDSPISLLQRIQTVTRQINTAVHDAQRPAHSVQLLAVSKTQPAEIIRQAYAHGLDHFGENYLQEAQHKLEQLADLPLCWHFIGAVQSNKTRLIAERFSWLHSLDRLKVAQRLSQQRPDYLPPLNLCIQVNISQDPNKAGVPPTEVEALAEAIFSLPQLQLRGLMAIPSQGDEPAFTKMQTLLRQLQARWPQLDTLSMGMSADLVPAILAGATLVRVGSALFGPRT